MCTMMILHTHTAGFLHVRYIRVVRCSYLYMCSIYNLMYCKSRALQDFLHLGWVERQIHTTPCAVKPRDPAPSVTNPVVHGICGTLTGLLRDVTGDLNSNCMQQ